MPAQCPNMLTCPSERGFLDVRSFVPGLWLDASDRSTVIAPSGVSEWRDKSGFGRHVYQSTVGNRPAYRQNGLNGLPVIAFTHSSSQSMTQSVTFPPFLGVSAFSVFSVVNRRLNGGNKGCYLAYAGGGSGVDILFAMAGTDTFYQIGNGADGGGTQAAFGKFNQYLVNTLIFDGTQTGNANRMRVWDSGKPNTLSFGYTVPATTSSNTTNRLIIGNYLSDWFLNGEIGEIIVLPYAANERQRQQIDGYLAWKWGTRGTLAESNPHFLSRPTDNRYLKRRTRTIVSLAGAAGSSGGGDISGSSSKIFDIAVSSTGRIDLSGSSSKTIDITGSATGQTITTGISGSSTKTFDLTASSSGQVSIQGSSNKTIGITASGTGQTSLQGSSTQTIALSGLATGQISLRGSSSSTITVSGSATGQTISGGISGSSSITIGTTGSATGQVSLAGSSSKTISIVASSAGTVDLRGSSSATIAMSGSASGQTTTAGITGSSSRTIDIAVSSIGKVGLSGVSVGSFDLLASGSGSIGLRGQSNKTIEMSGEASGSTSDYTPLFGSSNVTINMIAISNGAQINQKTITPRKKSHRDMIAAGLGWFEQQRRKHLCRDIVYTRKGIEYKMTATTARTIFENQGPTGILEKIVVMDFIISKEELAEIDFPPRKGDKISYNEETYEIMSLPGVGEFEYTDADRRAVRVHTKQVGVFR